MSSGSQRVELPELPLASWEATKKTLHLWVQIVGKIRMASTAPRNHWWHVPLYVDVRGLTTRRMHSKSGVSFDDGAEIFRTARSLEMSVPTTVAFQVLPSESFTDTELARAIVYMANQSGGNLKEPPAPAQKPAAKK